jgi:copper homeostasis protein
LPPGSLASAQAAQEGGADRVELCGSLSEGGITPSYGVIATTRDHVRLPIYVLIRPRGGDFLYGDASSMPCSATSKRARVLVAMAWWSARLEDGAVDPRCHGLVAAAGKMGVTFHRAFDASADLQRSLEDVVALGCERILTSGGRANALEGADVIAGLVRHAAGRIAIMAGAGIRSGNVVDIARRTGAHEFHGSARGVHPSQMRYRNPALQDLSPDTEPDERGRSACYEAATAGVALSAARREGGNAETKKPAFAPAFRQPVWTRKLKPARGSSRSGGSYDEQPCSCGSGRERHNDP